MDDSELKFEDIYNPIVEAKSSKDSLIGTTNTNCCSDICNLIFSCFIFM
jgi:hypothetical protein